MKWIVFCLAFSFCAWLIAPHLAGLENKFFHEDTIELTAIEQDIFNLINQRREAEYFDLPTLTWDKALYKKAKEHSLWMAKTNNFEHSAGAECENIFKGIGYVYPQIAESCVESWMLSPLHRRSLLLPEITHATVAIAISEDHNIVFATFMAR